MGSSLCKCSEIQVPNLILLSDPQHVIRSQIERDPATDIRSTSGIYVRSKRSLILDNGPPTSLVLGCKTGQRRNLLNKYLLTYLFFIKNKDNTLGLDITKIDIADIQIKDFTQLLTLSDTHNEFLLEISQFQQNYFAKNSLKDKADYLISEYFQDRFVSSTIQKFPIYSTDPTILGYLRRPIVDLHHRIASKYRDQGKKKQIYCVIQIPKEEQKLINQMAANKDHLTFSTFLRCFSTEQKARERLRELKKHEQTLRATNKITVQISTIFLNINIQRKLDSDQDYGYDYGFLEDESQRDNPFGDIIMNIFNFFEVTGARPAEHQYDLNYGSLAKLMQLRGLRKLKGNPELLNVIDVIEGQCEEIKTHSSLIRHIAERNLSITASNSLKNSQLGQKARSEQTMNLIEAYLEDREFDKALQQCQGTDQPEFLVRKSQILYESNRQSQAQQILNSIPQQSKKSLLKDHFKQYLLCEYLGSKIKKHKGERAQGEKQLKSLREVMRQKYKGRYEYRGREVERQILSYRPGSVIVVKWEEFGDGLNLGVLATR